MKEWEAKSVRLITSPGQRATSQQAPPWQQQAKMTVWWKQLWLFVCFSKTEANTFSFIQEDMLNGDTVIAED